MRVQVGAQSIHVHRPQTGATFAADPLSEEVLLGRQPILDASGALVAFELLFRGIGGAPARAPGAVFDDLRASSHVMAGALGDFGLADSLGPHSGYVNADHQLLMSDMVTVLPPERFVLEVLETTTVDPALRGRIAELRRLGYRIALDDVVGRGDARLELLPMVDIVKVDLLNSEPAEWHALARMLLPSGKILLAEKVETAEQFQVAREAGYDLFQGFFFAQPQVLRSRRRLSSATAMLRLIALLEDDPDVASLVEELKHHPVIATRLLRLANSSAAGARREVDSLGAAIALVGTRQIGRWVQLLLYAGAREHRPGADPLAQQVGIRARMMELLAMQWRDESGLAEQAFMTGMLSRIDVLLGMPLAEILADLPLSTAVRDALLEHRGALGTLLRVCEARERGDLPALRALCESMDGIDVSSTARAESRAAAWTFSLTARN